MTPQRITAVAMLAAGMLTSIGGYGQDGRWRVSTGIDISAGEYAGDSSETEIYYLPVTTTYREGSWRFQATVPWVRMEGPGTVVGVGDGGVVASGQNPPDRAQAVSSESGLGDIWLGATYMTDWLVRSNAYLDLGARVKLPTADERRLLGTGEPDYSVEMEVYKPFGPATPFISLAYRFRGDTPEFDLRDTWYLSVGSDLRLTSTLNVGLSLDYQEAAHAATDDAVEIVGYASHSFGNRFDLMIYGYGGLTDSVPDLGIGLQLAYGF